MKFDASVNIHNEFTIQVHDSRTGELKQEVKAYNIVLDTLFSRLVNRQDFFNYIYFGTGTGTLDATRTSLFTHLGYKLAVDHDSCRSFPTSYRTRKIVLAPEEYLGQTITEVGIAYGTSTLVNLVTHAMLKDAAGNPISITKAADGTDLITIYAKTYFELGEIDGMYGGKVRWVDASRNKLLDYLLGAAWDSTIPFMVGQSKYPNFMGWLATSANVVWTADAANKKMTTDKVRLDVNTGNGAIKNVWLADSYNSGNGIFQAILPVPGVHESHVFAGKQIAIGDGVATEFALPWDDALAISAVYVDGTPVTPPETHLALATSGIRGLYPDALPPSTGYGVAWSSDGAYLAVAHNSGPYLTVYSHNAGVLTKLANPDVLPPSIGLGVAWSPDGAYLAVAHDSIPRLTVYSHNAGVLTKLANPDVLPPNGATAVAWSSDGAYLAVAHNSSPYLTVYSHNAGVLTKLANPDVLPASTGFGVAWSADGAYLAVAHGNSPYLTVYSHNAGVLTKLANPDVLPPNGATAVAWSSDGAYLAVGHNSSPYLTVYSHNAGVLTKLANPDLLPLSTGRAVAWSPDGAYLAVGHDNIPYLLTVYSHNAGVLTKLANPDVLPAGIGYGVTWSSDGAYLAVAHGTSPYISLYTGIAAGPTYNIKLDVAPANGAIVTGDWTIGYVPKDTDHVYDMQAAITFGIPS